MVKAGRNINWKAIQHTIKMISKHLQATALHLIDSLTATENCPSDQPIILSGCDDAWPSIDAPADKQLTPAEVNSRDNSPCINQGKGETLAQKSCKPLHHKATKQIIANGDLEGNWKHPAPEPDFEKYLCFICTPSGELVRHLHAVSPGNAL
eukprot:1010949-Pelagomonas_calceolata.AAC.1